MKNCFFIFLPVVVTLLVASGFSTTVDMDWMRIGILVVVFLLIQLGIWRRNPQQLENNAFGLEFLGILWALRLGNAFVGLNDSWLNSTFLIAMAIYVFAILIPSVRNTK